MEAEARKAEAVITAILGKIADSNAFSNPVLLSQLVVRLAYSNHTVGRSLAGFQAAYRAKRKEVFDEWMAKTDERGKPTPVTRAKEEAEAAGAELEQLYDHFKNVHIDTQAFISVCQTHLRILGMEAKSQF